MSNYSVSVCMIAYNQEKYVAEAIESFLMQQTDGAKKLIIGEDCSIDTTRQICLEYQKRFPRLIEVLPPSENLGMRLNFIRTLKACKGDFIAICEGDDYWTDNSKLQKQVDFLKDNYQVAMCFHRASKYKLDQKVDSSFEHIVSKSYNGEDVLNEVFIPTASVVFRKNINRNYDIIDNNNIIYPDIFLWLTLANEGELFCLEDNMSVYRIQENSVTNINYTKANILRIIRNFKHIKTVFLGKYDASVDKILEKNYLKIIKLGIKKGDGTSLKFVFPYLKHRLS